MTLSIWKINILEFFLPTAHPASVDSRRKVILPGAYTKDLRDVYVAYVSLLGVSLDNFNVRGTQRKDWTSS